MGYPRNVDCYPRNVEMTVPLNEKPKIEIFYFSNRVFEKNQVSWYFSKSNFCKNVQKISLKRSKVLTSMSILAYNHWQVFNVNANYSKIVNSMSTVNTSKKSMSMAQFHWHWDCHHGTLNYIALVPDIRKEPPIDVSLGKHQYPFRASPNPDLIERLTLKGCWC